MVFYPKTEARVAAWHVAALLIPFIKVECASRWREGATWGHAYHLNFDGPDMGLFFYRVRIGKAPEDKWL